MFLLNASIVKIWITFKYLFQISTTHYFSIEKARKILGYNPSPCGPEDWEEITKSLRIIENSPKRLLKNRFDVSMSKILEIMTAMFSSTFLVLCTLYFYFI
jgi:hypothetical protein